MRIIGSPEESVLAHQPDKRWNSGLVRIAGDPTLAPEVGARLLAQGQLRVGRRRNRVHAVEPITDPPRPRLEDDDLEARKAVEHAELKERRERVAYAFARQHVEI